MRKNGVFFNNMTVFELYFDILRACLKYTKSENGTKGHTSELIGNLLIGSNHMTQFEAPMYDIV